MAWDPGPAILSGWLSALSRLCPSHAAGGPTSRRGPALVPPRPVDADLVVWRERKVEQMEHRGGSLNKAFKEHEQDWVIQQMENVRSWICNMDPDIKVELVSWPDPNRFLGTVAASIDQVSDDPCDELFQTIDRFSCQLEPFRNIHIRPTLNSTPS